MPGLRLRQRRPVHRREAARPRRQAGDAFRLFRLHLRRGGHRPGKTGLRHDSRTSNAAASKSMRIDTRFRRLYARRSRPGPNPLWDHKADCAFPSATQNEINGKDATNLVKNGVQVVAEGANMPTMPDGVDLFVEEGLLYGPGKAANAGGVSVSGLEMTQNSMRLPGPAKKWTTD